MNMQLFRGSRLFNFLLLSLTALPLYAWGAIGIGNRVALNDSLESLQEKLRDACQSLTLQTVSPAQFPLAQYLESHLVCDDYSYAGISFSKAVFTLADDRFVQMEATLENLPAVRTALGAPSANYLDFSIYQDSSFWLSESRRTLIWIHPDGLHPNLFAWRNPFIRDRPPVERAISTRLPELIDFTSEFNEQEAELQRQCAPALVEEEDNIWLKSEPEVQLQANCFNYYYAGFERKLELVFGDGKLQVVWVLTAKAEEQRIREALIAEWGSAMVVTEDWEVFAQGRISLRKDLPELLILSDEMIPLYLEELSNLTN